MLGRPVDVPGLLAVRACVPLAAPGVACAGASAQLCKESKQTNIVRANALNFVGGAQHVRELGGVFDDASPPISSAFPGLLPCAVLHPWEPSCLRSVCVCVFVSVSVVCVCVFVSVSVLCVCVFASVSCLCLCLFLFVRVCLCVSMSGMSRLGGGHGIDTF